MRLFGENNSFSQDQPGEASDDGRVGEELLDYSWKFRRSAASGGANSISPEAHRTAGQVGT